MAPAPLLTDRRNVPRRSHAKPQPDIVRRFLALTTPIGPVEARPMFGGYAFYLDGMIFALDPALLRLLRDPEPVPGQDVGSGGAGSPARGYPVARWASSSQ